jgi:hypothetical protein
MKTKMKSKIVKSFFVRHYALAFALFGITPLAQAAIINFTTGNFQEKGLGDEWGTPWDKITVTGVTGAVSGLDATNPQTATIATVTFQAGMNCSVCGPNPTGAVLLDFTFGSSTQQLTAPFSLILNFAFETDTLSVTQSPVIAFDLGGGSELDVNSLALGPIVSSGSAATASLTALFTTSLPGGPGTSAPEPSYALLLPVIAIGFARYRRRERRQIV